MTQVKMPKPVAFRSKDTPYLFSLGGPETAGFDGLITTEQAEAYANARVREALEKAAGICGADYEQGRAEYAASCNPYFDGVCAAAESIEYKILALIPKEAT
jgi:hypothetical protein